MGIWITDIVIARQIAEALREQNMLVMRTMRNRRLTRNAESRRSSWPRDDQDLARTVVPAAPLERVLVCGETGDDKALLAAPLADVPVDGRNGAESSVVIGRWQPDVVVHRSVS
jgi:hypothetical protein